MSRKCPYTYPHRTRAAMVEYICGIGGYYDHGERWPLEFVVSTHYADLTPDHLWKRAVEHGEVTDDALHKQAFFDEFNEWGGDSIWSVATEDAARGIREDDLLQTLWDGTELDVGLELRGRGGKHLVLTRFNGFTLSGCSPETLKEALLLQEGPDGDEVVDETKLRRRYEWNVKHDFIVLLYKYVRQCEVDFTSRKASDEVEYQAAWRLAHDAEERAKSLREEIENKEKLADHARSLLAVLEDDDDVASWRVLCIAAGITPPSL